MIRKWLRRFIAFLKNREKKFPMKKIESLKTNDNYGPCCATGADGADNLVFLPLELPEEFHGCGWGCDICRLPSNGALAVITDEAKKENLHINQVIARKDNQIRRMDIKACTKSFEHDQEAHMLYDRVTASDTIINSGDEKAQEYGLVKEMLSGAIYLLPDDGVAIVHRLAMHSDSPIAFENLVGKLKDKGLEAWFVQPRDLVRTKLIERGYVKYNDDGIITWRPK